MHRCTDDKVQLRSPYPRGGYHGTGWGVHRAAAQKLMRMYTRVRVRRCRTNLRGRFRPGPIKQLYGSMNPMRVHAIVNSLVTSYRFQV